jgi:uncharacterized protein (TIGR02145 family)
MFRLILILAISIFSLPAQRIQNVTTEQVGQTIHISYEVVSLNRPVEVVIGLSYDGGKTVSRRLTKLNGDVGLLHVNGKKIAVWHVLEELPELVGDDISFVVEIFPWVDGTFKDLRDGKNYKTVTIGNQIWMAENLAFKPNSGNYWAYENDSLNLQKYGYLYDWQTAKRVCPSGWHLPSDEEWTILTNYLGGESVAGGKMKTTMGWDAPNIGASNTSGFSGLPGGYRNFMGSFIALGNLGYWWSSTESLTNNAWYRFLFYNFDSVTRFSNDKKDGFSIRCLRD